MLAYIWVWCRYVFVYEASAIYHILINEEKSLQSTSIRKCRKVILLKFLLFPFINEMAFAEDFLLFVAY